MGEARKSSLVEELRRRGIYAHGSSESFLYEQRLTRYFTREYQRLMRDPSTMDAAVVTTNIGPMWEATAELMEQHYDESLELFRSFLDSHFMAYTTAYYGATPSDVRDSPLALDQAQKAKLELVCERAGIVGNEKIFNLGCGFGPVETYLAEAYPDVEVTSITPSKVQAAYIRGKSGDANHPISRLKLRLLEDDFGTVPMERLGEEGYDKVLAVGAFEHVHNLFLAFDRLSRLLKEDGRMFLHLIVSKPTIPRCLDSSNTLIGKYFPGGTIWPFHIIANQSEFFVLLDSWFINGMNYWKTLDEWHRNFWANIDVLHGKIFTEKKIRHWNEYFSLCKACFLPFDGDIFGNGHFLFRKDS